MLGSSEAQLTNNLNINDQLELTIKFFDDQMGQWGVWLVTRAKASSS